MPCWPRVQSQNTGHQRGNQKKLKRQPKIDVVFDIATDYDCHPRQLSDIFSSIELAMAIFHCMMKARYTFISAIIQQYQQQ